VRRGARAALTAVSDTSLPTPRDRLSGHACPSGGAKHLVTAWAATHAPPRCQTPRYRRLVTPTAAGTTPTRCRTPPALRHRRSNDIRPFRARPLPIPANRSTGMDSRNAEMGPAPRTATATLRGPRRSPHERGRALQSGHISLRNTRRATPDPQFVLPPCVRHTPGNSRIVRGGARATGCASKPAGGQRGNGGRPRALAP
jgi:hypothetical protein